jgi:hypothetical protein
MANTRTSGAYKEFATVDTAPDVDGYATESISIRNEDVQNVGFSIRNLGSDAMNATVTLQFKCDGDTDWTDYEDYTEETRKLVEGTGAGTLWRAIVKNGNYTAGEICFGFDW